MDKQFLMTVLKKVDNTAKLVEDLKNKKSESNVGSNHLSISFAEPLSRSDHSARGRMVANEIMELVKKYKIGEIEFSLIGEV